MLNSQNAITLLLWRFPLISTKENKMTEFLIINLKTIIYGFLCALLLYLYSNKKLKFISCWAGLTLSAWSFLHIM